MTLPHLVRKNGTIRGPPVQTKNIAKTVVQVRLTYLLTISLNNLPCSDAEQSADDAFISY